MIRILAALVVLVLTAAGAAAQSYASISGRVTDASGGVLAGARVEAYVAGRLLAATRTTGDGRYIVSVPRDVPVMLVIRREGFAEQVVTMPGHQAEVGWDVTMAVGSVADTVVVTAARAAESRSQVTQAVTVTTADEVEALGSRSLADIVRFTPGVAVDGNGREGALTAMFSRGGESDYNLVLIDGVRVNQNGGLFDFSRIAASDVERVEVVRGAQSALWGSDAMGAVVQVFTRRSGAADSPLLTGSAEGGSFQSWRGDARLAGGAFRRVDYHVGVSHRRTAGAFAELLPENDAFEQTIGDAGFGATLGARAAVRAGLRYSDARGRAVGPVTFGARDTGGVYDSRDLTWHASLTHSIGGRFSGYGTTSYFRSRATSADSIGDAPFATYAILEGTPNAIFPHGVRLVRWLDAAEFSALAAAGGVPGQGRWLASAQTFDFPFTTRTELHRPTVRYQGDLTWGRGAALSVGYEWERESSPLVDGFSLDNHAVFVQQQVSMADRWFLTAGVRTDAKEGFDSFVSPKLSGGGWLVRARRGPVSSLKLFGNIGRGIKSPSFSERFGASFADPNPGLEVERARTADLGIEATFASERLRGALVYFDNAYTNQIAYRFGPVGDGVAEFLNIDGSRARGVELEFGLLRALGGVTATASYSFLATEVVTNLSTSQQFQPGQPLLRRPAHSGIVRASYLLGRMTLNADTRIVGDRHDNSFLSLRTVPTPIRPAFTTDITVNPGYVVSGCGLDVRVAQTTTAYLRVNNVTDARYDSALGYPAMPRTVLAGLRFTLGR